MVRIKNIFKNSADYHGLPDYADWLLKLGEFIILRGNLRNPAIHDKSALKSIIQRYNSAPSTPYNPIFNYLCRSVKLAHNVL